MQFHCNRWSDIADCLTYWRPFPVKVEEVFSIISKFCSYEAHDDKLFDRKLFSHVESGKMPTSSVICNKKMSNNPKNWWKSMKVGNIDRESLHIFWNSWGVSMKFSGKIWLMIMLKTRVSSCHPHGLGGGGGVNCPPAFLGLISF